MKRIARIFFGIFVLAFLSSGVVFAETDVRGSKDHPLITRIADYYISQYQVSEFAGFEPTVIGGKEVRWEGKMYSFGYTRKDGGRPVSELQIVRNYEAAIRQIGGKILGGDERRVAT
jgi:OmpA-OmpF porin, OOP family